MIRKATPDDIADITAIYERIHDAEESGKYTIGWKRGVYPVPETATNSLAAGELYVCIRNGTICASARINSSQDAEYADGNWHFNAEPHEVLVLHTLVVDPFTEQKGCGAEFVGFYENMAAEKGCKVLRIDTQVINLNARRFYAALGFTEAGIVAWNFYGHGSADIILLEKKV